MSGLVMIVLAVAVVAFLVAPLLRADAAEAERLGAATSRLGELHSRHEQALAALRDLEDDRATAKIGDDDYIALKNRLTAQAIDVMKRIDEVEEQRRDPAPRPVRDDAPGPA